MANYITCKDNRTFAYAETTNKGYYEVVSVSEDGNTCRIKTVWHENKDYINKEYDIPTERAAEDFTAVDEMIVISVLERQILTQTGWAIVEATRFPHQNEIVDNLRYYCSANCNIWPSENFRDTREFLYIPDEESTTIPAVYTYLSACEKYTARDVRSAINNNFDRDHKYVEGIIVIPEDSFDSIVEEVMQNLPEEYRNTVEFPDELKLHLRSVEHKVVVLRREDKFVYMTNVKSEQIVFNSAIFFAEQIGRPLTEEAKAALIARNQEAYRAEIYKNINAIFDGMQERAKVKMFADFGNNFNGMLIKPLRSAAERARRDYADSCKRLNELFTKLQDANARLFYAEHGVQNGENEFISFINDAKANIVSVSAEPNDSSIYFCIRTFLTYWDDDVWDIFRKSDSGFKRLADWKKLMLDEIFKDRTLKLLIEQKFRFDTRYCEPERSASYYANPYGEGTKGIHNPHIHEYDCWGTHKSYIRDALNGGDYVQAYSQSVACISGLTLTDSPVMEKFLKYINNENLYDLPCLYVVEAGTYISINQYKQLIGDKKWEV